jgi:pimeloyl-ACP methyl ester carboxylesterase
MEFAMNNRISFAFLVVVPWFVGCSVEAQDAVPLTRFIRSHGDPVWIGHFAAPADKAGSAPAVLLVPGWPAVGGDVLGLGAALSAKGVHVFVIHPRGHGESGGEASFAHALEDVATAWAWLSSPEGGGSLSVNPSGLILVGYSWGGGIAMAFAARDSSVRRIASIAGSDHGVFIRRFDADPEYAALYRRGLSSTQAPQGPVRFDLDDALEELRKSHAQHDLVTLAPALLDRDLLLVAAWDDEEVEIERQILPFYRVLRAGGAGSVRLVAFQDGHGFRKSRQALLEEVHRWVVAATGMQ